ncbi:hypothetical protein AMTR_s00067p00132270 [Amborella trichopoda]|uniref:Uncharacterized protein n=1 Tax=Amborella trichopoda TaxID=13333 RepID=U5DEL3_AMBTC|nr:hypothetical protein AMTR_s00067p00132270 [Amborella trichopoda]
MVVDSDEEELTLPFGDQKLLAQIEGEQEDDSFFHPNIVLAISDDVDPLRVIPHLKASPLQLLEGPSTTADYISEVEVFKSDSVDVDTKELKVAAYHLIRV